MILLSSKARSYNHRAVTGRANGTKALVTGRHAAELLELFYPIHYRGTMAVEDAMRGELTRKQAAILWLIRSAGTENGRCMRRKEIVVRLQAWFDVSSPAITQAVRRMAQPPLGLVRLIEDPASAREKQVLLTARGERFIATMAARGRAFLQQVAEQLPEDQLSGGIEFLRAGVAAFERIHSRNLLNRKRLDSERRALPPVFPQSQPKNGDVAMASFRGVRSQG
jgi:DNA-binding MarR family transcriptional regulator